jgi:type IV pilus assembly protein PilY1
MKKIVCLSFLLIFLIPFHYAFANDTDLYILTQMMQQVPPDALVVLDLSGSMRWTPAGEYLYIDPGWTCDSHGKNCQATHSCGDNVAYYTTDPTGGAHKTQCDMMNDILLGTQYPTTAQYQSMKIWGDSTCSGPFYSYQAGNPARSTNCSKVALAKNAIFTFLDYDTNGTIDVKDENALNIRMGYMRFYNCSSPETTVNYNTGCNTLIDPLNTHYSKIYCNSSTSCTQSSSASNSVSGETASGGTPLAAALNEGLLYFNDSKNGDSAAACRQKFAILITDGSDTYACNGNGTETQTDQYKRRRETVAKARALANAGYYVFVVGFGADMPYYQRNTLNWAAYYGKTINHDQTQSITSIYSIPYGQLYPTGITQCQTSQTSTGSDGHYYATTYDPGEMGISGYAFIAQNNSELQDAIKAIRNFIITLVAQSTSYVAPVVPISQFQSTDSENRMYLGMFKPTTTTFWKGNIKKYGIATTNTSTLSVGDVIDANNQLAMTSQNTIKDTALSYWSSTADGGDVEKGGVGGVLLAGNPDSRNIYTYLKTNTNLTDSSNAFSKSNAAITTTLLGVSSTTDRNNIIDFVHGWDVWNWNNGPGQKRDWILGAIIHSRPLVIHYKNQDVIYVGANDGMLHAFNDADGTELWGFIPPDLLANLKNFNNQLSLQIFVDGPPKAYVTYDSNNNVTQAILIFGERRGGNSYIALDVTNPSTPKFLWEINPNQIIQGTTTTSTTVYQELGQTWSTPLPGKIKDGAGTKAVVVFGGGYDTNQDNSSPSSDTKGRAVYVVNITNGSQIWKYSNSNDSNMKYCIPSDIAPIIDVNGEGLIERLYVGDVGGQIWRFDIGDISNTASWTGTIIFKGSGKIFYRPDVTFENDRGSGTYDMLFFGTGDREKPNDTSFVNTLYAIKDYDNDTNPPTPLPLTETNLVDVTQDFLQSNATQADKTNFLNSLRTKSGWYIRLNQSPGESQNPGEKCDGAAVVFGGAVYFTTFTPSTSSSVCTLGTGQGNVYILQYQTGNAMFNLGISNDLGESQSTPKLTVNDRSMNVGGGIPSGIVLSITGGTVIAYGGVAGGVFSPILPTVRSIIPIDWRIGF